MMRFKIDIKQAHYVCLLKELDKAEMFPRSIFRIQLKKLLIPGGKNPGLIN